ncbi:hypothetical protein D3C80_1619260 [compost metagenome]
MDGATQENASLVGQAGQAAQALSERAQDLQRAVGAFKLDDEPAPVAAHPQPARAAARSPQRNEVRVLALTD